MEEQKTIERPLMSEEEFKDYMEKNRADIVGDFYEKGILHLRTYVAVSKFKSDYLLQKCGIGVSGNISAFQAEVDSSSLLFHSIYIVG